MLREAIDHRGYLPLQHRQDPVLAGAWGIFSNVAAICRKVACFSFWSAESRAPRSTLATVERSPATCDAPHLFEVIAIRR
jgi:hypothetical protein